MRDIFAAIRKHPWVAGVTATAVLGAALKFFLDKLILDRLGDLIFAAVGEWLGISDVKIVVILLSYAIPTALAGIVLWGVYRFAQYNAIGGLAVDLPGQASASAQLPAPNICFDGVTQETSQDGNTGRTNGYYMFVRVRNA